MAKPPPHRQPKSRSISARTQRPSVSRDLAVLARQLEKVKQQAQALGIFTDNRELLECPFCGLLEDVTSEGLLITYHKESVGMEDGGLRFIQVDDSSFQCPKCGTRTKAVAYKPSKS